jgi:hypothetical protein
MNLSEWNCDPKAFRVWLRLERMRAYLKLKEMTLGQN